MKTLMILSAAALAGTTLTASAGNLAPVVVEPAPEPVMATVAPSGEWTGFSAGVYAGLQRPEFRRRERRMSMACAAATTMISAATRWAGPPATTGPTPPFGADNLNCIGRVGARGGADLGQTLVYVTGGAAWAGATVAGTAATDMGWFGGIGAEHKLTDRWTVGGELLTNRFDDFNGSGTISTTPRSG